MEIVISRILKYLNGCLDDDHMYRIGLFVVKNYHKIHCCSVEDIKTEGHFTQDEIDDFCLHLGYHSFEEFKQKLVIDHQLRLDQITSRMINLNVQSFLEHLNVKSTKNELIELIDTLCDLIFEKERIIIVGALFPSCLAVDFQTDMITFGKEVIEYHHFDHEFQFQNNDLVLFMTATGRTMEYNAKKMVEQNLCEADVVLLTQNIKYTHYENVCADYVVHVLGKFDSIEFGYQVMMVLDIIRLRYYEKYYVENE